MTTSKAAALRTKVSGNVAEAMRQAVQKVNGANKAMVSAIDTLVAEGYKSTDFISPKTKDGGSTATPELFDDINATIVTGFEKRVQTLLAKPTKSLKETQKSDKRYWQQQIGARRNDFKRALEKRENVGNSDGAGTRNRTPEQRLLDDLNDAVKVAQNLESPQLDIVEFVGHINKALAMLNK